jgi:hypothetical protein
MLFGGLKIPVVDTDAAIRYVVRLPLGEIGPERGPEQTD